VQAVATLLGTTTDTVRRDTEAAGIEVARHTGNGPQTRLFTLENIYDLAAFRAKKAGFKTKKPIIVTVYAPKGGVGKTTGSSNLGVLLPLLGPRVLLVDIDFQANLTMSFGYDSELTPEEADEAGVPRDRCIDYHFGHLMPQWPTRAERPSLKQVIKMPYGPNGPHLIPAEVTLDRLDDVFTLESLNGKRPELAIAKWILDGRSGKNPDCDLSNYDVIIFDAAPAKSKTTRAALVASDYVVAPVSLEKYSTKSVSYLSTVLKGMEEDIGKYPELVLLRNFFDATRPRVMSQVAKLQSNYPNAWLNATISTSEEFRKILSDDENEVDLPLALAKPSSKSANELRAVTSDLMHKMGVI
jgi:chromosome partitioning protein